MPRNMKWAWRETGDNDYWIEDNKSQYYNQYVNADNVKKDWKKATKLKSLQYKRALEIKYNPENDKELGSAIFLHIWKNSGTKTSGSTSTSNTSIDIVLRWLDPDKKPVIMQYGYKNPLPKGFCYIKDYAPEVMYDIKFASEDNILGKKCEKYEESIGISSVNIARALNNASRLLRDKGYRLVVYDAYRPTSTAKLLSDWLQDDKDNATKEKYYPNTDKKDIEDMFFDEKSIYSRGGAIDVCIVDRNGNELDMGTAYQFIDKKSAYEYKGLSEKQNKNRKLLHDTMVGVGLTQNETFWWSFFLRNEPFNDEFDFSIK
jgi:D-alanyl-D-alanine dipeptidase